jgi:CheY-like chemotaxis protein
VKLLVIDDQQIQYFILQRMIEFYVSPPPLIDYFNEADKALEFIRENANNVQLLPDLIFLDLDLPVMSGAEFLVRLEQLHDFLAKNISVYIVSSSIDPADIALKNNFDFVIDYVMKPMTKADLLNIFTTCTDK